MLVWVVIISAAACVAGVVLLVMGVRGRRVDERPHCRRCGFDVGGIYPSGLAALVCPECGSDLLSGKGIRVGTRRRVGWVIRLGIALLAVGLPGAGTGVVAMRMPPGKMPEWVLQFKARTGTASERDMGEIVYRIDAGRWSGEHLHALAAHGLERARSVYDPGESDWVYIMAATYRAGLLSPEEERTLAGRLLARFEVEAAKNLNEDGELVVKVSQTDPEYVFWGLWTMNRTVEIQLEMDGVAAEWKPLDLWTPNNDAKRDRAWMRAIRDYSRPVFKIPAPVVLVTCKPPLTAGEHRLTVRLRSRMMSQKGDVLKGQGGPVAMLAERVDETTHTITVEPAKAH